MRDSGGHGGSSMPEINVPLVFLSTSCDQDNQSFNQIDLTPTLSVLFGLPIPASSIGVIIPNLLTELSMEQKLFAYFYNGEQLMHKLVELNNIHSIETEGTIYPSLGNCCFFLFKVFAFFRHRILYSIHRSEECPQKVSSEKCDELI